MHCAPRSPESGARAHYGRFKDAIAEPFLVLYYIICFSRCRYRYESQFLAFDTDNTPNKHSYCTYQYVQWLNVCCVFDLLLIGYFRSSWQHHSITIYELLTTAAYFCLKCCVILANWHLPSAARRRIQTTSQQREKLPLQCKNTSHHVQLATDIMSLFTTSILLPSLWPKYNGALRIHARGDPPHERLRVRRPLLLMKQRRWN